MTAENTKPPEAENPYTQHHVVATGETLSKIAKQYYGDPALYPRIFEANRDILTGSQQDQARTEAAHPVIRLPPVNQEFIMKRSFWAGRAVRGGSRCRLFGHERAGHPSRFVR